MNKSPTSALGDLFIFSVKYKLLLESKMAREYVNFFHIKYNEEKRLQIKFKNFLFALFFVSKKRVL